MFCVFESLREARRFPRAHRARYTQIAPRPLQPPATPWLSPPGEAFKFKISLLNYHDWFQTSTPLCYRETPC